MIEEATARSASFHRDCQRFSDDLVALRFPPGQFPVGTHDELYGFLQTFPSLLERTLLHHIRRTVSDRMKKDLGIAPWVVEALLGHAQERLVETYMPSSPLSLMRQALDAWNDHFAGLLKGKPRKNRQARR